MGDCTVSKVYQVYNWQHQPVKMFENSEQAVLHANNLRMEYDEGFYVVELTVMYSSFPAHSKS